MSQKRIVNSEHADEQRTNYNKQTFNLVSLGIPATPFNLRSPLAKLRSTLEKIPLGLTPLEFRYPFKNRFQFSSLFTNCPYQQGIQVPLK